MVVKSSSKSSSHITSITSRNKYSYRHNRGTERARNVPRVTCNRADCPSGFSGSTVCELNHYSILLLTAVYQLEIMQMTSKSDRREPQKMT